MKNLPDSRKCYFNPKIQTFLSNKNGSLSVVKCHQLPNYHLVRISCIIVKSRAFYKKIFGYLSYLTVTSKRVLQVHVVQANCYCLALETNRTMQKVKP